VSLGGAIIGGAGVCCQPGIFQPLVNPSPPFLKEEANKKAMSHTLTQITSKRATNVATPLDILFVLAAVVVGAFGWASLALLMVAAALVSLLLEEIVRLSVHRAVSLVWLRTITKVDMLILLGALVVNELFSASLGIISIATIIVWLLAEAIFWLRGHRITIDGWYHRAAILISLVAIEVSVEASKTWLYSVYGGPPSPLTHIGFHHVLDVGIGISYVTLLLFLAWAQQITWRPRLNWVNLRKEHGWFVVALLVTALPATVIGGWAAYVALSHQRVYGVDHPFAWLLAVFWVISLLSALGGFVFQQRVPSVSIIEAVKEDG
jgi:hypothetical protein